MSITGMRRAGGADSGRTKLPPPLSHDPYTYSPDEVLSVIPACDLEVADIGRFLAADVGGLAIWLRTCI